MRDIETNMSRLATGGYTTDYGFMHACLTVVSNPIPELRRRLLEWERRSLRYCESFISKDTQYVELVALEMANKLTPQGLINGINALPDKVHTIVLNGVSLKGYFANQYRLLSGFWQVPSEDILLEQAADLLLKFNRRIEFTDSTQLTSRLQKILDARRQQTLEAVSDMTATYASDKSDDIRDPQATNLVIDYLGL